MNTASYKNNGNNKYPVSTDTLDFVQEQIKLIYNITDLYGKYYILRAATTTTDGLIVWDGELMPLRAGTVQDFIALREERITVTAAGVDYTNARIVRYAEYTSINEGSACLDFDEFSVLKTISQLDSELSEAKHHQVPKGTVIDFYCEASFENIPYGWVPCCHFFKSANHADCATEQTKWRARYPSANVVVENIGIYKYVRVTSCNGVSIPDLSGKFIAAAGSRYYLGQSEGNESVTLTAAQSGLPAHTHALNKVINENSKRGVTGSESLYSTFEGGNALEVASNPAQPAAQPHENRPPFFALYKLIKVI